MKLNSQAKAVQLAARMYTGDRRQMFANKKFKKLVKSIRNRAQKGSRRSMKRFRRVKRY